MSALFISLLRCEATIETRVDTISDRFYVPFDDTNVLKRPETLSPIHPIAHLATHVRGVRYPNILVKTRNENAQQTHRGM